MLAAMAIKSPVIVPGGSSQKEREKKNMVKKMSKMTTGEMKDGTQSYFLLVLIQVFLEKKRISRIILVHRHI